jgi:hypothetical protein
MSLTTTAYSSRILIKYGGIVVVVFTLGYMAVVAGVKAYIAAHPPYVAPTVKYGLLPKMVFPDKKFDKKNFTMQLPNDSFPKIGDQANVYIVYRPNSTFLALDYDTKTAATLGFKNKPTEVSPGVYEFKNEVLNQKLTMNVLNGSFSLAYPYLTDQLLQNPASPPTVKSATDKAKIFLQLGSKLTKDLEDGTKTVTFWKIQFDGLKTVSSASDADLARVDFFRKNLSDGTKILSVEPDKASVSVLISGSETEGKKVVEVNYRYANIDRESFSTYPIKTPEQAAAELKSGNYWLATDSTSSDVAINKMYLAYFEPVTLTNYMQPIYVFEGSDKFVGYVPAVTDKYITQQ